MSNAKTNCLCGAVTITVKEVDPKFTVCHCQSCRTWGGGPFFAVKCGTNVKIEGEDKIKMYESSSWASRGFCNECGTHLFYKFKATGEYNMPVGMFHNLKGLEMDMQYFSDMRPNYYCFSNATKEMTTDEIMAYFSAEI
ncbi:GFA family protein [Colwellia sp. 4_MG-2023]|uniref:GFA family protein n=1 Tax=unclassified Colwellia TaxID=196834 RepID=UPI001C08C7F1|nr:MULTISPECIES: GFA family protein [unclassified Colwellia]MBU2923467.1 GFA family protein [Colwellia sp. C2M11]MDO6489065.1 GFA family protein [Colwellia sp. 6_MG-2023]MDO6508147.1 GFA family protein [Colwellia sp. 5_MG-2023]MDO6556829.1 GFA family protein [Colwellia sp. 4_MG-2023]MDO6653827.1 GFA family protein [Colwellia sp. 3_MG-2023]